jgi:hypothetical protein
MALEMFTDVEQGQLAKGIDDGAFIADQVMS